MRASTLLLLVLFTALAQTVKAEPTTLGCVQQGILGGLLGSLLGGTHYGIYSASACAVSHQSSVSFELGIGITC